MMRHLLTVLALLLLSACAFTGPSTAPVPGYGLGDSYKFDDGTRRQVAAASQHTVLWREGRDQLVTTRDILLPPLAIKAPDGVVRRHWSDPPHLFPLVPGKRVVFEASTEWHGSRGRRHAKERWACTVGGTDVVRTKAGTFDTIRVDCTVRQANSLQALHRTWFYAPAIGYYVRRIDRTAGGLVRVTTLTQYSTGNPMLPSRALRQRVLAMQRALERLESGTRASWSDPAGDARGSIEPLMTVRSSRYGWCREFRERMQVAERRYDLIGTACRDRAPVWQVRMVTPYREDLLRMAGRE